MKNNINSHILFLVFCMPLVLQAMDYDVESQQLFVPKNEKVCYRRQLTVTSPKTQPCNPHVVIEIFEEVKYKKEYPKKKGIGCADAMRIGCLPCIGAAIAYLLGIPE